MGRGVGVWDEGGKKRRGEAKQVEGNTLTGMEEKATNARGGG